MRLAIFILSVSLLACSSVRAQGTVGFYNDDQTLIMDVLTGAAAVTGTDFMVALFYAPDAMTPPAEADFVQVGNAVGIGPLDGLFNGDDVETPDSTPPGGPAWFQVRVWETDYGTSYADAIAHPDMNGRPALRGMSPKLHLAATGNSSAVPPTLPAELPANGLQPIMLNLGTAAFMASAVVPSVVGACGSFTLQVYGSGFQSPASVVLEQSGVAIPASLVTIAANGFVLEATFDLSNASPGAWDVKVTNGDGAVQTITGSLTVSGVSLTGISPPGASTCSALTSVQFTATGSAICPGAVFKLVRTGQADIVGNPVAVNPFGTEIVGTFIVSGTGVGAWDAVVINPSGDSATLTGAVWIGDTYLQFDPTQGFDCAAVTLVVLGTGICPGTEVRLSRSGYNDIPGSGQVVSVWGTQISATFNLNGVALGACDVVVTPPGGAPVVLPGVFTVLPFMGPTTSVIVPNHGGNCGPRIVNVGGAHFVPGIEVKLQRSGEPAIQGSPVQVNGLGNVFTTQFNLLNAAPGLWDLAVSCPGGSSHVLPNAFTVEPIALHLVTPVAGRDCDPPVSVTLSGDCFDPDAIVTLRKAGASIPGTSTVVMNSDTISSVFTLTGADPGLWDVEVTHPSSGDVATLPGGFTVLACTGCDVDVTISGPSTVGVGWPTVFSICCVNNGPLDDVHISVTGIPGDATILPITTTPAATIVVPGGGLPQTLDFTVPSLATGQTFCFYFGLSIPTVLPPVALTGAVTSPCENTNLFQFEVVGSIDPNAKTGLAGSGGSRHFIVGTETLNYEIHFENAPSATAPAQEVVITDRLDAAKLDLATFSLGTVTFGPHAVTAPAGRTAWMTYVPYDVDGIVGSTADDIVVKLDCALVTNPADPDYGRVTWALLSRDPLTGMRPTDPLRGFLPPNVTAPEGEGSVTFSVRAKPGLVEGDIIGNSASIVFDLNAPILTAVWVNAIDNAAPVSSVAMLAPVQPTPTFTVSWSGTDAGSGVANYDVFVADDGAPAAAFLSGTTATSATFTGLDGHTYAFYSVATDLVGHVEAAPATPDTTTVVRVSRPVLTIVLSSPEQVTVTWHAPGVLEEATQVNGPWFEIAGATSPHAAPTVGAVKFYRLRL